MPKEKIVMDDIDEYQKTFEKQLEPIRSHKKHYVSPADIVALGGLMICTIAKMSLKVADENERLRKKLEENGISLE